MFNEERLFYNERFSVISLISSGTEIILHCLLASLKIYDRYQIPDKTCICINSPVREHEQCEVVSTNVPWGSHWVATYSKWVWVAIHFWLNCSVTQNIWFQPCLVMSFKVPLTVIWSFICHNSLKTIWRQGNSGVWSQDRRKPYRESPIVVSDTGVR